MPNLQAHERGLKHHYPVINPQGGVRPTLFRYRHPNDGKRKARCVVRIPEWNDKWSCDYYAFCGEIAEWQFGDQLVCHFHGGIIVGGGLPTGINPDGKWQ